MSLFNSNSLYKDNKVYNTGHNTYIEQIKTQKHKKKHKKTKSSNKKNDKYIEYDKDYIKSLRKHSKHKRRNNNFSDDSEPYSESESDSDNENDINIGSGGLKTRKKTTLLNELDDKIGGADKIIKQETTIPKNNKP